MQKKKALTEPSPGIYYMVPDPKTNKYEVYTQIEEPGTDPVHLYFWDHVSKLVASRFKVSQEDISDAYTGIPRGRVIVPVDRTGMWIIVHGNDNDLAAYGAAILYEFGLTELATLNKVRWEHDTHENMMPHERGLVESVCGIRITKTGILPAPVKLKRK